MALIKCAECGKEISDQAASCPNCGAPVHPTSAATVQLTSKKWKKYQLVAFAFFIFGFLFIFRGGGYTVLGSFLWFIAIIIGLIARIGAWWTNG